MSPPSRNSPCLIISSLDATVGRVLDMIVKMSNGDEEQKKAQRETMEQFRELINADTLRIMQLLGFNYKAAIGEPPTRLCADKNEQFGNKHSTQNKAHRRKWNWKS